MGSSDLQALLSLSVAERVDLVEALWASIADETEAQALCPGGLAAVAMRRAEHREDPDAVVTWDEVKATLKLRS